MHTTANSPRSFEAALAFDVDYVEADVRFAADGSAYLSHDPLPSHLQKQAMHIDALLGLAARHPRVRLNLDMKEYTALRAMSDLVTAAGMASRVLLTGVESRVVDRVRSETAGLAYLLNVAPDVRQRFTPSGAASLVRQIRECGALGLNTHHLFVSRLLARSLHGAGLTLSVWTVDGERQMRRMLRLRVDNITTCRVDRLLALRQGRSA